MNESDLHKFLEENKDDIAKSIKEKAVSAMTESLRWQLPGAVQEAVSQFFKDEIIPELIEHLKDQKGPIIEAAITASAEIGETVSKLLIKTAVDRMTGYAASDVIKALMGVR